MATYKPTGGESLTPPPALETGSAGSTIVRWLSSTDHKVIGYLYLITSFAFFSVAGIMALIIRAELAQPGMQFLANDTYNSLFTMHGAAMLLLFATPLFAGFANVIMPLQIGAPDGTRRSRTAPSLPLPAGICGSWGWCSPVSVRSSAR